MPKRRKIRAADYDDYIAGLVYLLCVRAVKEDRATDTLVVTFEHLDKDQEGRTCEAALPLPPRPQNRTASFFRACGQEVRVDVELDPQQPVGNVIVGRFEPCPRTGDWRLAWFGPFEKETSGESGSQ